MTMAGEMGAGIAAPVVDALADAKGRFADPNLLDTVHVLEGLAEILNAVADLAAHVGAEAMASVRLHPTAEAAFDAVTTGSRGLAANVESEAAEVRRAEADTIQKIEDNDRRDRARDVSANND